MASRLAVLGISPAAHQTTAANSIFGFWLRCSEQCLRLGEVWANFPPAGAEGKMRLLETVILPALRGRAFPSPAAAWIELTHRMRRNAIQSG